MYLFNFCKHCTCNVGTDGEAPLFKNSGNGEGAPTLGVNFVLGVPRKYVNVIIHSGQQFA
jgi:hypothetical protein